MRDNTPSRTALKVAMIVILLGGDDYGRSKCPPGAIEAQRNLIQACRLLFGFSHWWLLQNPIVAKLSRWSSALVHPNVMEGIGIRKCFMEQHVRSQLNDNKCRQVLIIGAGYDTLACRLAQEYPQAQFYEVDHPATSRVKQNGLDNLLASLSPSLASSIRNNLHTIMADLTTTTLQQVLSQQEQYNVKAKTVVVMEGLLYYLSDVQVKQLFASISTVVGSPGSSVCFDFFGYNKQTNRLDLGLMTPFLTYSIQFTGEPWKWGIDPKDLEAFFQDSSWSVSVAPTSIGIERLACVSN